MVILGPILLLIVLFKAAARQAILVIDKNVEALMRIADRHYVIEKGHVVWTGTSAELRADEAIRHRYLGVSRRVSRGVSSQGAGSR